MPSAFRLDASESKTFGMNRAEHRVLYVLRHIINNKVLSSCLIVSSGWC